MGDRHLQRALEAWQPNYLRWWQNLGLEGTQTHDVYLYTAISVDSPVAIESCLVEHASVLEAAIVGRADDDQLIKPEAFVVLNDPSEAKDSLAEELLNHCKTNLARYKYPHRVHFVDDLPKTATGKI